MGLIERWIRREIMAVARDTIHDADPPLNFFEAKVILDKAYEEVASVSLMESDKSGMKWFQSFEGMCELIWVSAKKGFPKEKTRAEFLDDLPHDLDKIADLVLEVIDISALFPEDAKPKKKKKAKKKR